MQTCPTAEYDNSDQLQEKTSYKLNTSKSWLADAIGFVRVN